MHRALLNVFGLRGLFLGEILKLETDEKRARLVCEFLAGMTDGYAARTFRRLFEPGFGSIRDLVG